MSYACACLCPSSRDRLSCRDNKEQGRTPMLPTLRSATWTALMGVFAVLAAHVVNPARAADKVAVGTGGSASDAPFYIAYDRGFFKDEGLDVDLIVLDSAANVLAPLGTV